MISSVPAVMPVTVAVVAVHEEVDEWAGEQDQPGQRAEDVCLVFLPEEEDRDRRE